jgi:hypothetical protein
VRRLTEAIDMRRARQGWRLYATNLPAERMDLGACVQSYRGGWCLETGQADSTSSDRWCEAPGAGYDRRHRAA